MILSIVSLYITILCNYLLGISCNPFSKFFFDAMVRLAVQGEAYFPDNQFAGIL